MTPTLRFDAPPPFTKKILIAVTILYVAELILAQWMHLPLQEWMVWDSTTIVPWQGLSHLLFLGDSPLGFLFNLLALYFFLPPLQSKFGRKGVYNLAYYTIGLVMFIGYMGIFSGAVIPSMAMGLGAFITALVVVFGMNNPNATILLLFFPVQAIWIAWGTGAFVALQFLATRELSPLLSVAGWIAGWLFLELRPGGNLRKKYIRYKHDQKYTHLQVREGGKSSKNSNDTIH